MGRGGLPGDRRRRAAPGRGPGRELPEQDASRDRSGGLRRKVQRLTAKRLARPVDSTCARILPKQIQIKPSKNPWISLDLFVRIGTFQRVTSKKIKKIDSRLRLCAKRLKNSFHPFLLGGRPGKRWIL